MAKEAVEDWRRKQQVRFALPPSLPYRFWLADRAMGMTAFLVLLYIHVTFFIFIGDLLIVISNGCL
jgi:hypothetical protein